MSAPHIYRIRHADPGDLTACLDLRVESELAAAVMTPEHDRQVIGRWIESGAMHVVTNQIWDVVACFALSSADPEVWTPAEAAQPALYLYEFTISADHRDTGLGGLILDWCARRSKETGARWLRLDCSRTDTALQAVWRNRGFVEFDTREHPTRDSGALFQRDAGTTLAADEPDTEITLVDETVQAGAPVLGHPDPGQPPVTHGRVPVSTLLRRFTERGPLARAQQEIAETKDDLVAARQLAADDDTFATEAAILERRLPQLEARLGQLQEAIDRHDSTGEAAIWSEAATLVTGMKRAQAAAGPDSWNAALDQAASALADRARAAQAHS
jgi:hypothetical protein